MVDEFCPAGAFATAVPPPDGNTSGAPEADTLLAPKPPSGPPKSSGIVSGTSTPSKPPSDFGGFGLEPVLATAPPSAPPISGPPKSAGTVSGISTPSKPFPVF